MANVEHDIDRMLLLLRNKIRERGFTQLEVQVRLDWGRSYVSQLLTKQKSLRMDQALKILDVIGVEPGEFFAELYPADPGPVASTSGVEPELSRSIRELRHLARGIADLLVEREIIGGDELQAAIRGFEEETS